MGHAGFPLLKLAFLGTDLSRLVQSLKRATFAPDPGEGEEQLEASWGFPHRNVFGGDKK